MYLVARKNGSWEARESVRIADGPRSRTLATFRTLDLEAITRIQERSSGDFSESALRRLATEAGAPTEPAIADRSGSELLHCLARGEKPRKAIVNLLRASLGPEAEPVTEAAESMGQWIGAGQGERARALLDLLLLADHLPIPASAGGEISFPRICSQ